MGSLLIKPKHCDSGAASLITKRAAINRQDTPGQRDDSCPRQDRARFHHTTQNSEQFKIYELFISGIFYLINSQTAVDHRKPNLWISNSPSLSIVDDGDVIYLLRQFNHLTHKIFHILNLVDCFLM